MAQITCIDSDSSGNFRRIEYAMEDAVAMGAQLVCFPEACIFGWVNPAAHEMASAIPGKDADRIAKYARKYGVYVCIGLEEKEDNKLYDSVVLFGKDGAILLKHRKINILTELMEPPYTKGKGVQTVDTEFGKIGLMVCADSFVPEILQEMKELEPDLMLIPYGWAAAKDNWPQHGLQLKRTVQNAAKIINCPVIGTDVVGQISTGPWAGLTYGGQSYAVSTTGQVLAQGRDRERDIIFVELSIR